MELWFRSCCCGAVSMVVTLEMWLVELWQKSGGCEAVVLWLPSYTNGAVHDCGDVAMELWL